MIDINQMIIIMLYPFIIIFLQAGNEYLHKLPNTQINPFLSVGIHITCVILAINFVVAVL